MAEKTNVTQRIFQKRWDLRQPGPISPRDRLAASALTSSGQQETKQFNWPHARETKDATIVRPISKWPVCCKRIEEYGGVVVLAGNLPSSPMR